jgi:hypothetical protein
VEQAKQGRLQTITDLVEELEKLLPTGLKPAAVLGRSGLLCLVPNGDTYQQAFEVERIVTSALVALGDGPYGRAALRLFGATADSRGLPLRDRRRMAAYELDLLASTFRRNYEQSIITDLALEVWRISGRSSSSTAR